MFIKPDRKMFLDWRGYLVAGGAVALATCVKYLGMPNIITPANSLPYMLAIVPIAIYFGLGPAIFASLLSIFLYDFFFVQPLYSIDFWIQNIPAILIFLAVSIILSLLASNLREKTGLADREIETRKQAETELIRYREHLEEQVRQRTIELEESNSRLSREMAERLKSQEALKNSEALLAEAQQIAHVGSFEWDIKTGDILCSEEMYRIMGLDPETSTLTVAAYLGAVHPEDRDRVQGSIQGTITLSKPFDAEYRLVLADGSTIWVHGRGKISSYDNSGQPWKLLATIQDVSERKKTEEALAKVKEELEIKVKERTAELEEKNQELFLRATILDKANDVIFLRDLDFNFLYVNDAASKLYGYTREEFIGMNQFAFILPEDKPGFEERKKVLFENGEVIAETCHFLKDKSIIPVEIHSHLINIGQKRYILSVVHDITEQKRMKEAQETFTRRLIEAQEEEKARIARELHDDIAPTLAYLGLELDAVMARHQSLPEDAVQKMLFVKDKLDNAQQDVRRFSHKLHSAILENLGLQAALEALADEINERGEIKVNFRVEGRESRLADETNLSLYRIAQEALNNIQKHSQATEAQISLSYNAKRVLLSITDNGKGFDLSAAVSQKVGSLGLISMRERAALIGASLTIKSEPGNGTAVSVQVRRQG